MRIRFIDCGANVGQSIEWALKEFSDHDVRVDSFEPLPKNYQVLLEKFSQNERVQLHNAAVSVRDGEQTFYCQNWGARTGSSLIIGKQSASLSDAVIVKTLDLAAWIKQNTSEDEEIVLKIDVEGEEYNLLPHLLSQGIHKLSSTWLIEFHGSKIPNYSRKVESDVRDNVKNVLDWSRPEHVSLDLKKMGVFK